MDCSIGEQIKQALVEQLRKTSGWRDMSEKMVDVEATDDVVRIAIRNNEIFNSFDAILALEATSSSRSDDTIFAEAVFLWAPQYVLKKIESTMFAQRLKAALDAPSSGRGVG